MPSLWDFNFTGDDPGPDTDPTPDGVFGEELPGEDDATNYQEPGYGETFGGGDPTVFSNQGDPDEPEEQTSDVPPIETDEQTATVPGEDYGTAAPGRADDPEVGEHPGDEAAGDDEDDGPPDPALIDATEQIDSTEEVRYPEQGRDTDDLTVRSPETVRGPDLTGLTEALVESALPFDEAKADLELMNELLAWQHRQNEIMKAELLDFAVRFLDYRGPLAQYDEASNLYDPMDLLDFDDASIFDVEARVLNDGEDFTLLDVDGPDDFDPLLYDEFFTTQTSLLEFSDVVGGIDIDTMLVEFGFLGEDQV